ncbi:MAG TPA: hypothetical protein PKX00_01155 [Opitutaceae bacterium]|nr:hypothetical protein [Opitutaceae bacterium]
MMPVMWDVFSQEENVAGVEGANLVGYVTGAGTLQNAGQFDRLVVVPMGAVGGDAVKLIWAKDDVDRLGASVPTNQPEKIPLSEDDGFP